MMRSAAMSSDPVAKVMPWIRGSFTPMKRLMLADWMTQVNESALVWWFSVCVSSSRFCVITQGTITVPA